MKSKRQEFRMPGSEDEIRELAHLYTTEGFSDENDSFEQWLKNAPANEVEIFTNEVNAVGVLALAVVAPSEAPSLNLDAIVDLPSKKFPAGFSYLPSGSGSWRELPAKGVRVKELSDHRADGFTTMLLEMDPGAKFPSHHHHGTEQVYLLDGDLLSDGEELLPGDFLRAAADTHHGGLVSKGGCHALIITAQENYPRKAVRFYDRLAKGARRVKKKVFG